MRITPKQYALTLYELVGEAKKDKTDEILKNFFAFLDKNNDFKLIDKVIKEFEEVWNDKKGVAEVEIVSTDKLNKEMVELLKEYLVKQLNKKNISINQKVDKSILGGIVIKYKDTVVDGSLRKKIALLKQKLEK